MVKTLYGRTRALPRATGDPLAVRPAATAPAIFPDGNPQMTSLDSFKCARTLKVGSRNYIYYSLPAAEKNGLKGISRLPFP